MSKKVYVGNLNYATTEETLRSVFSNFGEIESAVVIYDRMTQQSKGFGFVEFSDDSAAENAINEMNGKEVDGRRVRVNTAEDRPARPKFSGSVR
ncbi:MAG: RNA recognition motif domain-containing protein [Treponema sp.]